MVKTFLVIVATFVFSAALTGCGKLSQGQAAWTGYSTQCVDGVSYLQFTSGVTVQYSADGKIKTCEK